MRESPYLVVANWDRLVDVVPNGADLAVPLQLLLNSIVLCFFLGLVEVGLLADQVTGIFLVLCGPAR